MSAVSSPEPRRSGKAVFAWIASLFTLKRDQFHAVRGLIGAAVVFVPLIALKAVGHEELWLSFSFGALFTYQCDLAALNQAYATRVRWSAAFVLVGMLLTALGYLLGGAGWVLVALAVFVSTLLSYLAAAYGPHGAVAGVLLNIWFLIVLSTTAALGEPPAQTWSRAGPQVLAWLAGGVLWLPLSWAWLRLQRAPQPSLPPPAQTKALGRVSRPQATFAGLAALAVALATAVAWAFDIRNADWMPVAAIVAMKPSLEASVYVGGQRVAGTLVGAVLAAILLTIVDDRTLLIVLIVVLATVGGMVHDVSYALYCACISTEVLISLGLPHPGSLADNWQRVAWTLAGVAIALAVTYLADMAHKRAPHRTVTA